MIGNEACDCDSIISAISWAWKLHIRATTSRSALENATSKSTRAFVPIINCARSDWPLRREAGYLLERCVFDDAKGVHGCADPSSMLVFLDDLLSAHPVLGAAATAAGSGPAVAQAGCDCDRGIAITLMDHNELKGPLAAAGFGANVVEIVDHHLDVGAHPWVKGAGRMIDFDAAHMKGVGSTCTLVARSLLELQSDKVSPIARTDAANATPAPVLDAGLAEMLASVIIIDTVGLSAAAGRTTQADLDAVEQLQTIIEAGGGPRQPAASLTTAASAGETGAANSEPAAVAAGTDTSSAPRRLDVAAVCAVLSNLKSEPAFWRGLSMDQALSLDYKMFEGALATSSGTDVGNSGCSIKVQFGTSSIMVPLGDFLGGWAEQPCTTGDAAASMASPSGPPSVGGPVAASYEAAVDAYRLEGIKTFIESRGLSFQVLLSMISDPTIQRELAFVAIRNGGDSSAGRDVKLVDALCDVLLKSELKLQELHVAPTIAARPPPLLASSSHDGTSSSAAAPGADGAGMHLRVFRQGNVKASRKQAVPMILAAMKDMGC